MFAPGRDGEHQHVEIEMGTEMRCSKEQPGNKRTNADIKNGLVICATRSQYSIKFT
jgi:hypothetical protein